MTGMGRRQKAMSREGLRDREMEGPRLRRIAQLYMSRDSTDQDLLARAVARGL